MSGQHRFYVFRSIRSSSFFASKASIGRAGVYLERVFVLASEYRTHNLLLLPVKAAVKRGPLSMLIWLSVSSLAARRKDTKSFVNISFPLRKIN